MSYMRKNIFFLKNVLLYTIINISMLLEIIISKFSCILKMMSRNRFPEPQPDSASYTGSSANFSIISEVTCLGFHCHISHGFRALKKCSKFHHMFLMISGRCLANWITTSPHYVEVETPRAMGSIWRISCNWDWSSGWETNWWKEF